eukprot:280002-Chlamydomonas_euryale.AAC.1
MFGRPRVGGSTADHVGTSRLGVHASQKLKVTLDAESARSNMTGSGPADAGPPEHVDHTARA